MNTIGKDRPSTSIFNLVPSDSITIESLSKYVTRDMIDQALQQSGSESVRCRQLPAVSVVWLVIGMSVFRNLNTCAVWRRVSNSLQALYLANLGIRLPYKSALCYARQRLGARAMRLVFLKSSSPVAANKDSSVCFYHGMLLTGIDGVRMRIADTPSNRAAFGAGGYTKRDGKTIEAAYPQIHGIASVELGTHVVIDALVKPGLSSEHRGISYLIKHLPENTLLMVDCGFYSYNTVSTAIENDVNLLGRAGAKMNFKREKVLSDGSFITTIYPTQGKNRVCKGIVIRIIEYTIDDPNRPGYQQRHRIYTTLLDADQYPAKELVVLYHQRWEQEIAHDEIKTHQLTKDFPVNLRSKTAVGVIQEFYGLLIAYNCIRKIMYESASDCGLESTELSFTHSIEVIRETIEHMRTARVELLPIMYKSMLKLIAQGKLPSRSNRVNPRVVKTRRAKYKRKPPNMPSPPQPQKPFEKSIVLLN